MYTQDKRIVRALLERLMLLLQKDPKPLLKALIAAKAASYPSLNPDKDADVLEDKVLQDLINMYDDQILEDLWRMYNINYFEEDTYELSNNSYYASKPKYHGGCKS